MNEPLCQSCGRKLDIGYFGTNHDGSPNNEYCKYCFENGDFKEPDLTLDEMMGRATARMIDELQMERPEAETNASTTIPQLKRWKK